MWCANITKVAENLLPKGSTFIKTKKEDSVKCMDLNRQYNQLTKAAVSKDRQE